MTVRFLFLYGVLTIEKTPDKVHTIKDMLTLPVCSNTPVGDTKIPDPMMLPTMTVTPFRRVILGLRVISSLRRLPSSSMAVGHVMPSEGPRLFRWRRPARAGCKWINSWTILAPYSRPFHDHVIHYGFLSAHFGSCCDGTDDVWLRRLLGYVYRIGISVNAKCNLITFGMGIR